MTKIFLPEPSLVILVGTSGSGKSTFAKKHFKPTEVISSDYCRALVSDDENDQASTADAFDTLHYIATKRLKAGKLTVIDATNVQPQSRKKLVDLARSYHVLPVAMILNIPRDICLKRNNKREDRDFGQHVIQSQHHQLQNSLKSLKKREGITHVHIFNSVEEVEAVEIKRQPTWTNKNHEKGPFDIIGDIHGCFDETKMLLEKLGYIIEKKDKYIVTHPQGRRIIFVGDLVDRGPKSPEVLRLAMDATASGIAFCVNGNHDDKLKRKLMGRNVKIAHGLQETLEQLENESIEFKQEVLNFLKKRISHYVLDDGKLAVAHAGLKQEYIGRGSPRIREFCMYGETTGEIDEFGLAVRYPWAKEYRGDTLIVYGHTPIPKPEWLNNTINIDTGCVFGGKLTALKYPEKELVSVDAKKIYSEPVKPLNQADTKSNDNILNIEDVIGKRVIDTKLQRNITIREENSIAALEIMSRFAIDPRWLIYLPPTMSPPETCKKGDLLEHPDKAFNFYKKRGIKTLICEEKHMGSRAIIVICRDNETAKRRFEITDNAIGSCYTRTGRSFFTDTKTEQKFLAKVQQAVLKAGLWDKLNTNWICFDTEIMPWSAKAQSLLEQQYAPVGAAAKAALPNVCDSLLQAAKQNIENAQELHEQFSSRLKMVTSYCNAYRQYCWPVNSIDDYKLAPFHILAHENSLNLTKNHLWHLDLINLLCESDPSLFQKTLYKIVDLDDESSQDNATKWWFDLTNKGGEGMVVKPLDFTMTTDSGLIQPGIKCRSKEYLRIIYGPEYTDYKNIERLRARGLRVKRSLALREYALGYEALNNFVNKAPLYKVHEAVFGVLALESDPVDPRL